MTEEQIAEYQNDLVLIEKDYTRMAQQRDEKIKEIREIDTRVAHLQGAAAWIRGKLTPQQVEETEEVTTQQDGVPIQVHEKAKEMVAEKNKKADIQRSAEYPPDK